MDFPLTGLERRRYRGHHCAGVALAGRLGRDGHHPRNLTKSVTVE